jgi:AcrR family transcriptional regulator
VAVVSSPVATPPVESGDEVAGESGWTRRRRRIRDELEAIALEQFAATSIDEVTVEQIAAAAGISVRTFFRYFATKEDVLLAEPSRFVESVCAALRERPADETLLQAVHAAIRVCDHWELTDPSLSLLLRDALARNPGLEQRILGNVALLDRFRLGVGERLGLPDDSLEVRVYAHAINGVIAATLGHWASPDTVDDLIDEVGRAFDLLAELE